MILLITLNLIYCFIYLISLIDMSTLRLDALTAPSSSSQVTVVNPLSNNVVPGQMAQAQIAAQPLSIEVGYLQREKKH